MSTNNASLRASQRSTLTALRPLQLSLEQREQVEKRPVALPAQNLGGQQILREEYLILGE